MFQVGIQELQSVERNAGVTRVCIIASVIRYLIFRKALRTLSALKHGTELCVRHAQHIDGEEVAVYPVVGYFENVGDARFNGASSSGRHRS